LNSAIKIISNGDKSILKTPVAAFFFIGLTRAPASQLRNALLGQVASKGLSLLWKIFFQWWANMEFR